MHNEESKKFTKEDEELLRKAIRKLKNEELMQEPFDGYWEENDDDI
jgi:hypothetical protein